MNLPAGYESDEVIRLEVNLDDLSPEITAATTEKLLRAGALDVWLTPIQMKKNRAGIMVSVLCDEASLPSIADLIFEETSTFGVRLERIRRLKLEREFSEVLTRYGKVTMKLGRRQGKILQAAPEFDSCRDVAEHCGEPLRKIYEAALLAYGATLPSP